MILRTAVLSIFFISSIHCLKLHEHMTKQEIESVFNCKHDEVHKLEYEVVPILHKDNKEIKGKQFKMASPKIELKAFNKSYTLYIESNNHVLYGSATPFYTAKWEPNSGNHSIVYKRVSHPFDNIEAYHDVKNRAAVTIHRDTNNRAHVDGLIGDNIVIRSLPARIHEEVLNKYSDLYKPADYTVHDKFSNLLTDAYQPIIHVVVKQNYTSNKQSGIDLAQHQDQIGEVDDNPFNFSTLRKVPLNGQNTHDQILLNNKINGDFTFRTITSPPVTNHENIVYPQIMVVIDYETYKTHGSNVHTILKYMLAFWNAVDLRYRELQDPKVRLNIAGIIIPEELSGAPYMEHIDASKNMLVSNTIANLIKYFKNQNFFSRNSYDFVIGLTTRKLKLSNNAIINGLARSSGPCTDGAAAIVFDKGGFNGITTAAHELAHLLGVKHDTEIPQKSGGPCPKGYLMGSSRWDVRGVHWSQCSIRSFRYFLKSSRCIRLKNKPNVGTPYPKILPGTLFSRDEQCKKLFGKTSSSVKILEHNCAVLYCQMPKIPRKTFGRPPAEGSSCSGGGICLNGQCVRVPQEFNTNNHLAP